MPKPSPARRTTRPSAHSPQAPHTFELVELRWILKTLGAVIGLALVCGYITLCIVYSRTQWQLVLHPSRDVTKTPASLGLRFIENPLDHDPEAFDAPRMYGWDVPSDSPSQPHVLLLHSGDGSMSDALPTVRALHDAHLNVFIFDYRGYGKSAGTHPTEASMEADADEAYHDLTGTPDLKPSDVIIYGSGVGASLAVRLCAEHPEIPALILESPRGDLKARALADNRSGFIPARLLFTQDFPLAAPLHTLSTPKLLISYTGGPAPLDLQRAADPKMTVELAPNDTTAFQQTLRRFLDTYVPRPPAMLSPQP